MKPAATFRFIPADFIVDEIPAYPPLGSGAHAYVRLQKVGRTTFDCIEGLARALTVPSRDIGHAGMKDRHAVTTQWLSIPWSENKPLDPIRSLVIDGMEILEVTRHGNKLRPGHLLGNRFAIVLRDVPAGDIEEASAILRNAELQGFPNVFGPQRFGRDGTNPEWTLSWLRGEVPGPRDPKKRRLLFSSVQSWLFDRVLAARVADGTWRSVIEGDVVKKLDTGGLFDCTDETEDAQRAERREVTATGPIFGADMRWPKGRVQELERSVLEQSLRDPEILNQHAKLGAGTRRALRAFPTEMSVRQQVDGTLAVDFVLPKGCYATTLLGQAFELNDVHGAGAATPGSEETSVRDELLYDSTPAVE